MVDYTTYVVYTITIAKGGYQMKVINLKINDLFHKEFKTKVASEGCNMQEKLKELIKSYLDKEAIK